MMQSGILLQEEMHKFCKTNNYDEGLAWQTLNKIHTEEYGRNIIWEKNQYEKENNLGDVPLCEYFAKQEKVSNAIRIIKGMQNCINNGWGIK